MKWIVKALVQRAISYLPDPRRWNYLLQRTITKSLPVSDEVFIERFGYAYDRLAFLGRHNTKPLGELRAFEFGAGWDLAGPIAYYAMGINDQLVVDIRPGLRWELVNNQLEKLRRLGPRLEAMYKCTLRIPSVSALSSVQELHRELGIRYAAPSDARATGLAAGSIDFISTNSTLEHIAPNELAAIFKESHRILADDGFMVHFVDMQDHHSSADSRLSVYNFLSVGEPYWSILNADLNYQNRLRASDYVALFREAGFAIAEQWALPATPAELEQLRSLKLLPRFAGYQEADLSAKVLRIVLRKQ